MSHTSDMSKTGNNAVRVAGSASGVDETGESVRETVNASQAAQIVGISERTMRTWLAAGRVADATKRTALGGPAEWVIPLASLADFRVARRSRSPSAEIERLAALVAELERRARELHGDLIAQARRSLRSGNSGQTGRRTDEWAEERRETYERSPTSSGDAFAAPADRGRAQADSPLLPLIPPAHSAPLAPPVSSTLPASVPASATSPFYPPRSRARTMTRPLHSTGEHLPNGLVGWRAFSERHGISVSTVKDAIEGRKLPVVRGEWKVGRYYVKGALDAEGQRVFYRRWAHRQDFRPCPDCPHKLPDPETALPAVAVIPDTAHAGRTGDPAAGAPASAPGEGAR